MEIADVTDLQQRLTQPAEQPVSERFVCHRACIFHSDNVTHYQCQCSQLYPCRKLLLTKRSLRCRACVNAARPGILLKPQINPLTGDSSMRAKSAWWKKAR